MATSLVEIHKPALLVIMVRHLNTDDNSDFSIDLFLNKPKYLIEMFKDLSAYTGVSIDEISAFDSKHSVHHDYKDLMIDDLCFSMK